MSYLIKIYCPENGLVLDPFCGSGSTGIATLLENRDFWGIDLDQHFVDIAQKRIQDYVFNKKEETNESKSIQNATGRKATSSSL
jgi:DNA modification methylase